MRDSSLESLTTLDLLDGFMSQLLYMENEYDLKDFELFSQINAHIIRWTIYYPFMHSGIHDYIWYTILLMPLAVVLSRRGLWAILLILLVMPWVVSYRSGLAAIGLTSVYIALLERGRSRLFFLGSLMCVMSSATLLQSVLFTLYIWFKRGPKSSEMFPALILLYFLGIAVIDKFSGALSGEAGYSAPGIEASSILLVYLMRSTIVVGFLNNNPRAYVFLALLIVLLAYLLRLLLKRGMIAGLRKSILITILPGFALEGLGVVSALPILILALNKR